LFAELPVFQTKRPFVYLAYFFSDGSLGILGVGIVVGSFGVFVIATFLNPFIDRMA
jgi:hypothetical protein